MAKKDLENYYNSLYAQYTEMSNDIDELERQMMTEMVDPKILEQMKITIAPIAESYNNIKYAIYLLNLPKSKTVITRNKRQFDKKLNSIEKKNHGNNIIKNNDSRLDRLREITNA